MFKYLVNISDAEVQLIEGKVKVPFKSYVPVSKREADHDDVADCIRRKWVKLIDREPTPGELEKLVSGVEDKPEISFSEPEVRGTTEPPRAKKAAKAGEKPAETTEEIK